MKHDPDVQARIDAQIVNNLNRPASHSASAFTRAIEAGAVAEAKAAGAVPAGAGDINACAPARGPVRLYDPVEVLRTESGGPRYHRMAERGAKPVIREDAFDRMEGCAAGLAKARGKVHVPLFTVAQVEAGRLYAQLTERLDAGGVRCSSLEALRAARASGGGSWIDARIRDRGRVNAMIAEIGDGWAMSPRRVAPNGDLRQAIRLRLAVDMVCLADKTLSDVLRRFGWAGNTKQRAAMRLVLCQTLDRMRGHSGAKAQNVG